MTAYKLHIEYHLEPNLLFNAVVLVDIIILDIFMWIVKVRTSLIMHIIWSRRF